MRVSTRIGLSAVAFAIPITVLVAEIVSQYEANAAAIERERSGLVAARDALDAFDALVGLRMALASRGALTDTAPASLRAALEAVTALEASVSDASLDAPLASLRASVEAISLDDAGEAADEADGDLTDVELAEAEVDDFAALRLPGDEAPSRRTPLDRVEAALEETAAVLRALDASAGFSVDADVGTNALLGAGTEWLPRLASDLAHLVHIRAQPGFGTSAESGVVEGLVVDRVLPIARDRLSRAGDLGSLGTRGADVLSRALSLATRVPAFDDDERDAYEADGRVVIVATLAHARQALAAADETLATRLGRSRRSLETTLSWSGIVILVTALLVGLVLVQVMRSLARLSEASTRIADGDRTVRLAMTSDDEIGTAARSFDRMANAIMERDRELEAHARDLELRVAQKNASLQAVLDGIGEGVLVAERSGVLTPERSRHVEAWLGPIERGASLAGYLAGGDPTLEEELALGLEQLAEDILPFDVAAAQMPKRLQRGDKTYALAYRRLDRDGALDRVLVVVHDVTSELARADADRRARELPSLVQKALSNRAAFAAFVSEVESLLTELGDASRSTGNAGGGTATRLRALHTLKGTCASHGLSSIAERAHEIETGIAEGGATSAALAQAHAELTQRWRATLAPLSELLASPDTVEIPRADHAAIVEVLERARASDAALAGLLERVREAALEPVRGLLEPLAVHAGQLARDRGKQARVTLRTEVTHLGDGRLRPVFTSLVHLVRNAVDHGIEAPAERRTCGKSECGTITIDVMRAGPLLRVVVEDDGRGIDWDALAAGARARGHVVGNAREEALFLDGVSSRADGDEVSGRGVGLAAVRAAARAVGGQIAVETGTGRGTKFSVELPLGSAA